MVLWPSKTKYIQHVRSVDNEVHVPDLGSSKDFGSTVELFLNATARTEEDPGVSAASKNTTDTTQSKSTTKSDLTITTTVASYHNIKTTSSEDDEPPRSVIHAPPGFNEFITSPKGSMSPDGTETAAHPRSTMEDQANQPERSNAYVDKKPTASALLPHPLTTAVEPITDWSERATPRAQTMADFRRFDISSNLNFSGTSEQEFHEKTTMRDRETTQSVASSELEVTALKAALAECWSLCNTLASLSHIHQERSNWDTGAKDKTWECCWRLCQELYNSQDCDYASQINPTLDLCRDFCQTLFNGRDRGDDLADSILRVSFELNSHLYNTHDRNLPDAFRERTLDFYITMCHRLMKQRSQRFQSNSLLGACWSLAEMLFSIRQGKREKRQLDEELLGSAVQACWELCDIFREGWTRHRHVDPMVTPRHIRNFHSSDSGTPRPSQTTFRQTTHDAKLSECEPSSGMLQNGANPETPTTIFEETVPVSPDDVPIQNIFVLGQEPAHGSDPKRPSSSSSTSGQTLSSEKTTSTNTITTLRVEQNLKSIRVLVMKAAVHSGFQPNGVQALSTFTKSLSSNAFGSLSWQTSLLRNYKRLVAFDPGFRNIEPQHQASAIDIARAVQAIIQNGSHSWLQDLYQLVFGFCIEEALGPKDTLEAG